MPDSASQAKPLVVSVNIPFCPHRCSFCDAAVHNGKPTAEHPRTGDFELRTPYLNAVVRELRALAPDLAGHSVRAVVIEGGVPTVCPGDHLGALVRELKAALPWDGSAQVTLTTVPGMLSADAFDTLRGLGVRRYEFGMGSFNFFEYELLDRPTARDAIHNMRVLLQYARVEDLGVRLFWGIPGQTEGTVRSSVDEAVENGAVHVRLERLPLGPDTPLARAAREGGRLGRGKRACPPLPDEDACTRLAEAAAARLQEHGLVRYAELPGGGTCFARAGHEGVYERERAAGCDYVTLGLGGESLIDGLRTVNTTDLATYVEASPDPARIVATVEDLSLQE